MLSQSNHFVYLLKDDKFCYDLKPTFLQVLLFVGLIVLLPTFDSQNFSTSFIRNLYTQILFVSLRSFVY